MIKLIPVGVILASLLAFQWQGLFQQDPSSTIPVDLAIDLDGSIFMAGSTRSADGSAKFVTLKFSPNGELQWVANHFSTSGLDDRPVSIRIDSTGAIYVAGNDQAAFTIIKYSPDGETEWISRFRGPEIGANRVKGMAIDSDGSVYVTGNVQLGNRPNIVLVKYSSRGKLQWWVQKRGICGSEPAAVSINTKGEIYITGWTCRETYNGPDFDFVTVKFDNSGKELWSNNFYGPDGSTTLSDDRSVALVVDTGGNSYITGTSAFGFATVKYDNNGLKQWDTRFWCSSRNSANALAIDESRNIYVAGSGCGDITTIKYDPGGNRQWIATLDAGSDFDSATALARNDRGDIYIIGGHSDLLTIKYNLFGDEEWVRQYDGIIGGQDFAVALDVDLHGDIYVTGGSAGLQGYQIALIKYDSDGNKLWVNRFPQ